MMPMQGRQFVRVTITAMSDGSIRILITLKN